MFFGMTGKLEVPWRELRSHGHEAVRGHRVDDAPGGGRRHRVDNAPGGGAVIVSTMRQEAAPSSYRQCARDSFVRL